MKTREKGLLRRCVFAFLLAAMPAMDALGLATEAECDYRVGSQTPAAVIPNFDWSGTNDWLGVGGAWSELANWRTEALPAMNELVFVTNAGSSVTCAVDPTFRSLWTWCMDATKTNTVTFTGDWTADDANQKFMVVGSNTCVRFENARVKVNRIATVWTNYAGTVQAAYPRYWCVGNLFENYQDYFVPGKNARLEFVGSTISISNAISANAHIGHRATLLFDDTTMDAMKKFAFYVYDNGTATLTNHSTLVADEGGGAIGLATGSRLFVHDSVITNRANGASPLSYYGNPTNVIVRVTGASHIYCKDQFATATSSSLTGANVASAGEITIADSSRLTANHFGFTVPAGGTMAVNVIDEASLSASYPFFMGRDGAGALDFNVDTTGKVRLEFIGANNSTNANSRVRVTIDNGQVTTTTSNKDCPGVAFGYGSGASLPQSRGELVMNGGTLNASIAGGVSDHQWFGFMLGRMDGYLGYNGVGTNYTGPSSYAPYAMGRIALNGGSISNNTLVFAAGLCPHGTGVVEQTGGRFYHACNNRTTTPSNKRFFGIGVGGGYGRYTISGGTLDIYDGCFVGGVPTNNVPFDFRKFLTTTSQERFFTAANGNMPDWWQNRSVGTLEINGGEVNVTNSLGTAMMKVGADGTATLAIGSNGVLRVDDLTLAKSGLGSVRWQLAGTWKADNTCTWDDGSAWDITENTTTVKFTAGANGFGQIVADTASVSNGVKFVVDMSAFEGDGKQTLMTVGSWATGTPDASSVEFVNGDGRAQFTATELKVWREKGIVILVQ